ncbi:MAG: cytochrome C [SAR86 cluster bacterium]|uniref:Cytochrome C n=1 Tax=SAR86 cluster bacterium TaxID=2030880 RepID=A0A2A4X543_9GAMM|nr:MAG: cytochrome C [SAR86 cluster bacterium]
MKKENTLPQVNTTRLSLLFLSFVFCSLLSSAAPAQDEGEQLFLNNCAECHQRDGKGIANIYPALADSEVVRGSGVDVALVMLIGRGEMPSFSGSITFEDMADIINYVRNAWGNSGEEITAQRIANLQ